MFVRNECPVHNMLKTWDFFFFLNNFVFIFLRSLFEHVEHVKISILLSL